jgi:signal transduction histidine kinase
MGLAIGIAVFLAKRLSVSLDQARAGGPKALAGGAEPPTAPPGCRSRHAAGRPAPHQRRPGARARRAPSLQDEREALLRSEQEARRQAEAQSNAKDAFLAMLSHELRNPLAAIAGAVQVLDLPA